MKRKSNLQWQSAIFTVLIIVFCSRLVTHSPLPRSSSCSPIEYYDPHSSTLLQLLKNISEEVDDLSPKGSAALASLSTLQGALSRSTSPNVQRGPMGNLITIKAKSTSPPKITKEIPTKKCVSVEALRSSENTLELQKISQNFDENLASSKPDQAMPLIQITLTESQEKKKCTTETINAMMQQGIVVQCSSSLDV